MIGVPSSLRLTRKDAVLPRMLPTLDLSCVETAVRRKWKGPLVNEQAELWTTVGVVYYETRKRDLKIRPAYDCRCDENLKTKVEDSTRLSYTGFLG